MDNLNNIVWSEKYRPKRFDNLILDDKEKLLNYLKNPKALPNFLFISKSPGSGKTSCSKIIAMYLNCDCLRLNASDERGIEMIRQKIKLFVRSMSSNPGIKRMVFLDEGDGITNIAQNSLRNIMEEYSNNAFFVMTCNNVSKIIEPIRSRCIEFYFDKPDVLKIASHLAIICRQEKLEVTPKSLDILIKLNYPNIRNMVKLLQDTKISGKHLSTMLDNITNFKQFYLDVAKGNIEVIKNKVFKSEIDVRDFNYWLFKAIFNKFETLGFEKSKKIIEVLAENEKYFSIGSNQEVIFLNGCLKIIGIMK